MDHEWEELGRLKPNQKIALCLDMTEVCFRTCAAGIRAQNPDIADEELIIKLQERIDWTRHPQQRRNSNGKSGRVH